MKKIKITWEAESRGRAIAITLKVNIVWNPNTRKRGIGVALLVNPPHGSLRVSPQYALRSKTALLYNYSGKSHQVATSIGSLYVLLTKRYLFSGGRAFLVSTPTSGIKIWQSSESSIEHLAASKDQNERLTTIENQTAE